jgi:hypothetical protein
VSHQFTVALQSDSNYYGEHCDIKWIHDTVTPESITSLPECPMGAPWFHRNMDWNAPERRRKLVTYGKSSQKEVPTGQGTNSRPQASVPFVNAGLGIGASARVRPHLQTQTQEPETSHSHRVSHSIAKESIPTRKTKDGVFEISDLTNSRDGIQNTLRSPKRQRISTEGREHPSQRGNSPFSAGHLPSRPPAIAKHCKFKLLYCNGRLHCFILMVLMML